MSSPWWLACLFHLVGNDLKLIQNTNLPFYSAKINGVNVVVSKGSNSSEKPVLSRSPSAFKIGYNISRDVVTN